jgi:hypothetical protein
MSRFGARMTMVTEKLIAEFGDPLAYTPMVELPNGEPSFDGDRLDGTIKAVLTVPGVTLGFGWQLATSLHSRSDENPCLFYRARDLLAKVQKPDEFFLAEGANTYIDGPRRFAVSAVNPIGFGWHRAKLIELPLIAGDST